MLQFYYDLLYKYVDRKDFQYAKMDTDSEYMALSASSLKEVILKEMREEFYREWKSWFQVQACNRHHESWVRNKVAQQPLLDSQSVIRATHIGNSTRIKC